MTDVEAIVQRYYGDRPVLQRIEDALRAAGVDPEKPSHRDLWPFDQLHSRGMMATREHAERARIQPGMHVLEIGCGLGGASRYLAAECGCRVGAIDFYVDILGMPLVHAMKVPPTSTTNNRASIIA
jgi:cyclopropane fatty-acyl-phospholipid synthase-like methyltransferase